MADFNYSDTLAVTRLAKKVLVTAGYASEKLDGPWSSVDEFNWKSYCDKMGGVYTPFPELGLQPQNIKEEFELLEGEVESVSRSAQYPQIHKDVMVHPYQRDKQTGKLKTQIHEMDHAPGQKSKPGTVNFGIMQGSMSRFTGKETPMSNHDKIHAPNPSEMPPPATQAMLKKPAQVHTRNADGKEVQPGKDVLNKVHDPAFDPSAPPHNEITDKQVEAAPNTTDLSAKEGTDEEKKLKDKRLEATQKNASTSVR